MFGITDLSKQFQRFLHTIDVLVLHQHLIVFRQRDHKQYSGHVIETVNPFLALITLMIGRDRPRQIQHKQQHTSSTSTTGQYTMFEW